jgi:hypothetical protein
MSADTHQCSLEDATLGAFAKRLEEYTLSYSHPLILEAALRNKVFDALADGPKTLEETVSATSASSRGLRAIMDALVPMRFLGSSLFPVAGTAASMLGNNDC